MDYKSILNTRLMKLQSALNLPSRSKQCPKGKSSSISKKHIRSLRRRVNRKRNREYLEEKRQYEETLQDLKDEARELSKTNKSMADKMMKEIKSKSGVENYKVIKEEVGKQPRNKKRSKVAFRAARYDLASVSRKAEYNPENIKSTVNVIAANRAGIKTKRNNKGNIVPDFKGVSKEKKKKFRAAKRVASKNTNLILEFMSAYEKSYGVSGKVANSDEVMANITEYVETHDVGVSDVNEVIEAVYDKTN